MDCGRTGKAGLYLNAHTCKERSMLTKFHRVLTSYFSFILKLFVSITFIQPIGSEVYSIATHLK